MYENSKRGQLRNEDIFTKIGGTPLNRRYEKTTYYHMHRKPIDAPARSVLNIKYRLGNSILDIIYQGIIVIFNKY